MNYHAYEMAHSLLAPLRWSAVGMKHQLTSPLNPFRSHLLPRMMAAGCDVFESVTRRYGKPEFGITETRIGGMPTPIREEIVLKKPFCQLIHFDRDETVVGKRYDPKVLLIAPMSGHYATLLRGTVEAMIREHNVYITDWTDARNVPAAAGPFDLDDFIDYIIEFIHFLGPNTHVIAVCQPSVPVLAAAAVMAARNDPLAPVSMTLMGGPIDTRRNPTLVNKLAAERPIEWFERNVISHVPFPNPGFMRPVYPGFIQLSGFMQMNLDRHMNAHRKLFDNLVKGDCDSVQNHRDFYEEYLAVMDLPAEFYLQTVETVFQEHSLPDGKMMHRGELVELRRHRQHRADDRGRRARRHLRPRPDRGGARSVHRHSRGREIPLCAGRRRPLRRLQRHPLAHRDPAAHPRIHPHHPVQADGGHAIAHVVALSRPEAGSRADRGI